MGKGHPDTATIYINIGKYYQSTGGYLKALEYCTKALDVREKVLGTEHIDTAETNYIMGSIYKSMGDHYKALEYFTEALAVREKDLSPNSAIAIYSSIILIYESMGDYYKALKYSKIFLSFLKKIDYYSASSSNVSIRNIAELNSGGGMQHPERLKVYQKFLPIFEKVLGKEHPDIATSYANIGTIYSRMRDYPAALKNFQKSLAIYKKVLGKEHPDIASIYGHIGGTYNKN